jgi:hypothetical protein
MHYISYDKVTGVTLEYITTTNITNRVLPDRDYIQAPDDFSPRQIGKTKVVGGNIVSHDPVVVVSTEELLGEVRAKRNLKLMATDFTQMPDSPVDGTLWLEYRQQLRDITDQEDLENVVWPTPPA